MSRQLCTKLKRLENEAAMTTTLFIGPDEEVELTLPTSTDVIKGSPPFPETLASETPVATINITTNPSISTAVKEDSTIDSANESPLVEVPTSSVFASAPITSSPFVAHSPTPTPTPTSTSDHGIVTTPLKNGKLRYLQKTVIRLDQLFNISLKLDEFSQDLEIFRRDIEIAFLRTLLQTGFNSVELAQSLFTEWQRFAMEYESID